MPINKFNLFTSYFSAVMRHPDVRSGKLEPISVATSQPNGFLLYSDLLLTPLTSMVYAFKNGKLTEETYRYQYRLLLDQRIKSISIIETCYSNVVLVCWEKAGSFCHRRIFADWYFEKTGYEIPELQFGDTQEELKL